jgi:ubiquinone/menaquinone biosynthesis C-methylase UbiE
VTGLDYVPALLDRGRARALVEGLNVTFAEGDAENLPYPDNTFDAVLSCVGVMFTPNQEQAAAELVRVCRPGGKIALANWTPEGFIGGMFRTVTKHVPPPAGLKPPGLWGTEDRVDELLGHAISDLRFERRRFVFRFRSEDEFVEFFRAHYGPVAKAFEALDDIGRERLHADLTALVAAHDTADGPSVAIPSEYLEAIAVSRTGVRKTRG